MAQLLILSYKIIMFFDYKNTYEYGLSLLNLNILLILRLLRELQITNLIHCLMFRTLSN